MFTSAKLVTPVGMLAPLPNIFFVMRAEMVTILGTEMVLRPPLVVVVSIVRSPVLILSSAAIVSSLLCNTTPRKDGESSSQHGSKYVFVRFEFHSIFGPAPR